MLACMRIASLLQHPVWSLVFAALLIVATTGPTDAREFRNDSAEPGTEIGFYPRLQGGQFFSVYLDAPDDLPTYKVCAVTVWIGPDDFNVFLVDLFGVDEGGQIVSDVYRSDLDAFQVFGSEAALNEIDLREYRLVTSERRLLLRLTHAEGFDAPPTIAFDGDGITPLRNQLSGLRRDGSFFLDFTENLVPDDPLFPRPPGDWVLRLLVVAENEVCPVTGAVEVDAGVIVMPPDAAVPPPDAAVPPPPRVDAAEKPDGDVADARRVPDPDDGVEADVRSSRDARPEREMLVEGALDVTRISPDHGPASENTAVLIDGRGFPADGDVEVFIGPARALEVVVEDERIISAIVPGDLDPGVYDVEVIRGDGASAVLSSAFTVTGDAAASLELTGVLPNSIVEDTLPTLTLLGRGFTDDVEFFVGPVMLQGVSLASPQRATAILSTPLTPAVYEVSVRKGDQRAVLAGGLTVLAKANTPKADGCDCRVATPAGSPGVALCLTLALGTGLRRRRRGR